MKLYYSGNSPYARRARVAVREAGLLNQVEEINLGDRPDRMDVLLANGPGAKVPVLATADGVAIWESLIICKYLDEVSGGKLYPADRAERQTTLQLEAMGSVLMDALFVRSREKRRDPGEQSPGVIELEAERARRTYDALEAMGSRLDGRLDNGCFTIVATLGYADWRHPDDDWRDGRPKLLAAYDALMQRPSLSDTAPVF